MTSLLLNDELHNDRVNPYTATGTFGVSYNGGYKQGARVLSVETEVDDDIMFTPGETDKDTGIPKDHFNPLTIDRSGGRYLGTRSVDPAKSFLFPARKYQFDDGSTNFGREIVLMNAKNYVTPEDFPDQEGTLRWLVIGASILLVILLALQRRN
ncbi:hypothetical protein EBT25_02410 [bacterium]|nr:hypothetical protein [bacterium]